jgi:hypothetical protein
VNSTICRYGAPIDPPKLVQKDNVWFITWTEDEPEPAPQPEQEPSPGIVPADWEEE